MPNTDQNITEWHKYGIDKPTGYLIWDNGVLMQELECSWQRWGGYYWMYEHRKEWVKVPTKK
jgi:hypothetical protein